VTVAQDPVWRGVSGRGTGPDDVGVYVGGSFQRAGDVSSWNVSRWARRSCRADVDASGGVDGRDVAAVLAFWGPCAACPEDVDRDGTVAMGDLGLVLAAWGACGPGLNPRP
jgi:hypothetical protein